MCVQFYQLAVISFIELEFTYHKIYHYTYLIWWSFEDFEIMQSYMPSCDLVYWSKMGRFISWEFAFWPAKPVKEKTELTSSVFHPHGAIFVLLISVTSCKAVLICCFSEPTVLFISRDNERCVEKNGVTCWRKEVQVLWARKWPHSKSQHSTI